MCTKALCCVGRWPGAVRADKLEHLPSSLKSATLVKRAQMLLGGYSSDNSSDSNSTSSCTSRSSNISSNCTSSSNNNSGGTVDCPTDRQSFDALLMALSEQTLADGDDRAGSGDTDAADNDADGNIDNWRGGGGDTGGAGKTHNLVNEADVGVRIMHPWPRHIIKFVEQVMCWYYNVMYACYQLCMM